MFGVDLNLSFQLYTVHAEAFDSTTLLCVSVHPFSSCNLFVLYCFFICIVFVLLGLMPTFPANLHVSLKQNLNFLLLLRYRMRHNFQSRAHFKYSFIAILEVLRNRSTWIIALLQLFTNRYKVLWRIFEFTKKLGRDRQIILHLKMCHLNIVANNDSAVIKMADKRGAIVIR